MSYAGAIPAARVGDVVHDVSLYDHFRTTAALAAALYRYHAESRTLSAPAIQDGTQEKFLLVGGDFYGIQEFIFSSRGDSRRFRSKLLRGRSFAVSLFAELSVALICERTELPFLAVLLNAAGKFHLLAPNLPRTREILSECEIRINDWLFTQTYGEGSLGIACTTATPNDFQAGCFRNLWDRHLQNLERRKYRKIDLERHSGEFAGYLDSFNNEIESGKRLCPLCGKRASVKETENDAVFRSEQAVSCAICRDHVYLGTHLVKGKMVAICDLSTELPPDKRLRAPIFDRFQVSFTGTALDDLAATNKLLGLWQTGTEADGALADRATMKLINGHVPCYRKEDNHDECLLESTRSKGKTEEMISQIKEGDGIKTFGHIAVKARHMDEKGICRGVEALGVLKADVDNLGMLLGCGFSDKRFTISRLATVSRQLHSFFTLYLPHLLASTEEYRDVYTVFAGGDDLFLIGPWNRMADLASHLRQRFADFACLNPRITFSAGITVHKPNTPVDTMAEAAEDALKSAKVEGRDRVTMFGHTVKWDDFTELLNHRVLMQEWLRRKYISDAMFYRFNHLVAMAEQEGRLGKAAAITIEEMACVKWPALFRYSLARNINAQLENRDAALIEVSKTVVWIEKHRGAVRIPLWHVLYEKRA